VYIFINAHLELMCDRCHKGSRAMTHPAQEDIEPLKLKELFDAGWTQTLKDGVLLHHCPECVKATSV
jgi:hypothetical protein